MTGFNDILQQTFLTSGFFSNKQLFNLCLIFMNKQESDLTVAC